MRRHTRTATLLLAAIAAFPAFGARADTEPVPEGLIVTPGSDLVRVRVVMPDGRVITRYEERFAARIEIPEDDGRPIVQTGGGGVSSLGAIGVGLGGAGGGGSGRGGASGGGGGGSGGGGGGGGGGGAGTSATAPLDGFGGGGGDTPGVPVTVYTWDRSTPEPFQNMIQTIVIDPRAGEPVSLANRIASRIIAENPAKVALRFWFELSAADRSPFDLSDPVALWRANGFSDGLEEYWSSFASRLRERGVAPDYLVQDLEKGVSFWHVPAEDRPAFFGEIFANRAALTGVFPTEFFSVDVQTFLDIRDPAGSTARSIYNNMSTEMRTNLIRETMHRPFVEAYGRTIPHSNYNDIVPSYEVLRHYNFPWTQTTIHGISAPSSYLVDYGAAGTSYSRLSKHPRWNSMIGALNAIRSAAASGPVHPWIAPPGYGRRGPDTWARSTELDAEMWLWNAFMDQCLAMGVDTFILWNPPARWNPNAAANDRYMDSWFGGKTAHHERLSLPAIPLDADEFETNGVTVRYSDFTARFGAD